MSWYQSLPPAETSLPCGKGTHAIRWEEGRLILPDHPDPEAELVLAALGGDKPACLTMAETWEAHGDDLAVLAAGPRSDADRLTVTADQLDEHRKTRPALAGLLELMALGPEFQFRLSGAVAAAWAREDRAGERAEHRAELAAALTGRFAPVAAGWLGVDPDAVIITPHEGPGWGSLEVTRDGALTGTLPAGWLAGVWACGLALSDGHLVVSVTEPGYPRARVLALPEPGAAPIPLDVSR